MKHAMIALAALGATVTAGTAAPAFANTEQKQTIHVEYADLNLATAAGQKTLNQRIIKAAREVCGMDRAVTGTRVPTRDVLQCFHTAKAQAEKQFAAILTDQRLGG
ncbi:UrcA family protein [Altererythrobacter confluentis]|uniref:UrcA family protein n=1 Tax=Allopontixanthobacter confluentis TaxID=1849021 RepID=A0A6L7GK07_9SPHN|nr:UrcA family protein [Allopontixanthobacter confluentis]MXP15248.1 UrcA family protein [Allopontixanthobacter confluentis]